MGFQIVGVVQVDMEVTDILPILLTIPIIITIQQIIILGIIIMEIVQITTVTLM